MRILRLLLVLQFSITGAIFRKFDKSTGARLGVVIPFEIFSKSRIAKGNIKEINRGIVDLLDRIKTKIAKPVY